MLITFRVDASYQIGSGHVMRCMTLAKALRKRGVDSYFISREHGGHMLDFINRQGFDVWALPSGEKSENQKLQDQQQLAHVQWLGVDWKTDARQTIDQLAACEADWLVVDHYALDARWETELRPHVKKILVIDDLADRCHDCDLLLDQNLIADLERRYNDLVSSECVKLLGPHYALLQPEYAELSNRTPPRVGQVKRILVFFGGADQHNLTELTLTAFLALQRNDIVLDIVISPQNQHAEKIRAEARRHENVIVYDMLPSLASLMLKADLAVGAAGATSWERCCLGLPALVVTLAENQKPIAAALDDHDLARYLGHFDTITEQSLGQAIKAAVSTADYLHWSSACMELVDGRGVDRVSSIMLLKSDTPLLARAARPEDVALLLHWKIGELILGDTSTQGVDEDDAFQYCYYRQLREPGNFRHFIVESVDGIPVGWVGFKSHRGEWTIHHSVGKEALGTGLDRELLSTALGEFRQANPGELRFAGNMPGGRGISCNLPDDVGPIAKESFSISVCSGEGSWIDSAVPELILKWLEAGHTCCWAHDHEHLTGGDMCFYLSYGQIVDQQVRSKFRNNLVAHASDLPKGRGWSPTSWMIIEGESRIPVTLFEAVDAVDAGVIYGQKWFDISATDLADDWRIKLSEVISGLLDSFVNRYPAIMSEGREQLGEPTFYPKRVPGDSRLDVHQTISQQFNLLRIVDNDSYPAFFEIDGQEFVLRITRRKTKNH